MGIRGWCCSPEGDNKQLHFTRFNHLQNPLQALQSTSHALLCPGSCKVSAVCSFFSGLFSTNCAPYKQCKLLILIRVCFGTSACNNWHSLHNVAVQLGIISSISDVLTFSLISKWNGLDNLDKLDKRLFTTCRLVFLALWDLWEVKIY